MTGILILMAALPPEVHEAMEKIDWLGMPEATTVQAGPSLPGGGLNSALLDMMNRVMPESKGPPYIIGDTPNETLMVTGTWEWNGDVVIMGNGVLLVQGGTLIVHGNIYAYDQGKYLVYDGTVRYPQMFTYQWITVLTSGSRMEARRSTFDYNGFNYNFLAMDSATVEWDTLLMQDLTTAVCLGEPVVNMRKVNLPGEWLYFDSTVAHFAQVDTMLNWFIYGQGSVIDFDFPAWENVDHLVMEDGVAGVSGIDYSVSLDTIGFCMWGTILQPGCNVTFRNSPIRTVGIMGLGTDSQNLNGLVNGMSYSDFILSMTDRYFRLVNTSVMTWSLYPSDTFFLTFDHCIVGEVLTMANAIAWGQSYFLDGTGGHFEASGNSFNIALLSSMTCEIYTKESGTALLAVVGIPVAYGGIWARNTSRLILVQCQFPSEPVAYDSGLIYILGVDEPYYAGTESFVPIIGSARINEGPLALTHFDHYNIYWAPIEDTSTWNPLDNPHDYEVKRDTLAVWDTHGLSLGTYLIKLVLWDDSPDSLDMMGVITLNYEDTTGTVTEGPQVAKTDLAVLSGPGGTTLELSLAAAGQVDLCLYDITGKRISVLCQNELEAGRHMFPVNARPGVYFARLVVRGRAINRKLVIR